MDYRGERDALRARVETLEQALDETRRGESVARVEAELVEADDLVRRLRGELDALQVPEKEPARASVGGTHVLEAEIAGAEARIQRLRAVLHEVEKAPGEAEALIQRLRLDLSGIEDARREAGAGAPTSAPGAVPIEPLVGRGTKIGIVLAGIAFAVVGVAAAIRHREEPRLRYYGHRDACEKAIACCRHANETWCHHLEFTCESYLEDYCNGAPGTASVEAAPQSAPPTGVVSAGQVEVLGRHSSPSAPLAQRIATPRWTASVQHVDGIALPGSLCHVDATLVATGRNAWVKELRLECGGRTLYDSSDSSSGLFDQAEDTREVLGPRDDQSAYTLRYRDVGTRRGPRSQVDLDSTKRIGVVLSENLPRWRVDLAIRPESQPAVSLSSPNRLRREGHVTEGSGVSAAQLSRGAACVLRALNTGDGDDCIAEVRCGAVVLFPTSAEVHCGHEGDRVASVLTSEGAATALRLDGTKLEVETGGGKASRTVIALDPPDGEEAGR